MKQYCHTVGLLVAVVATVFLSCGKSKTIGDEFALPTAQPDESTVFEESETIRGGLLTVIYSSDEWGEIRSCGCPKKDLGGLGRRATYVASVKEKTRDLLLVQAGDLFGRGNEQGRLKAEVAVQALADMNYDAVGLGKRDFAFGKTFLKRIFEKETLPYVSTNIVYQDSHEHFAPNPYLLKKMPSGTQVLILSVLSERLSDSLRSEGLKALPAADTLRRYVKSLGGKGIFVVVLAYTGREEATQLARQVPGIDLIVTGHIGTARKTEEQAWLVGETILVQGQPKGKYVGRIEITLNRDAKTIQISNETVAMENTLPEKPEFKKLFAEYREEVKKLMPADVTAGAHAYATSNKCAGCHVDAVAAWDESEHAKAFSSLEESGQTYDPECIECHVLGFGEEGGFVSIDVTPELANVHCENCHGSAVEHLNDQAVEYGHANSKACVKCHTPDFSPDFQYAVYWAKIAHGK